MSKLKSLWFCPLKTLTMIKTLYKYRNNHTSCFCACLSQWCCSRNIACRVSSKSKYCLYLELDPIPPPSARQPAVAWLFPSESLVTLRQMSSRRDRVKDQSNEVWWRWSQTAEEWRKLIWGQCWDCVTTKRLQSLPLEHNALMSSFSLHALRRKR